MRLLYLVRHASPQIQPEVNAREWTLSERGVAEAQVIAGAAESWGLEALYCSTEPKARATALIIGEPLGLAPQQADAFDELRMAQWISNADRFNETVKAILAGDAPRDAERADVAAARFAAGVEHVAQGPMPAAVVSHGRVLTAYLSAHAMVEEPFEFWRAIPMPGWCVIDLDEPRTARWPAFSA
jgi:broad specificity phosphatase PhoE